MNWEQRWAAGETRWDHGRASPPLEEFLATRPLSGRAIVPGCGSGHDVRLLATHGLQVTGMDIAPSALAVARGYPPADGEVYREGDWLDLPDELTGAFDWVVEHTCLCALQPTQRPAYAASVMAALRPGGHYLAVIYTNPESDAGPPFRTTAEDMAVLFCDLDLIDRWKPTAAFASRRGREEMYRYRKPLGSGAGGGIGLPQR